MLHMHVYIYTLSVFVCTYTYVHLCYTFPLDFDECSGGLHNCSHVCVNTHGSHLCDCRQGYQLMEDGVTCQGENLPEGLVLILVAVTFKLMYTMYNTYVCQTFIECSSKGFSWNLIHCTVKPKKGIVMERCPVYAGWGVHYRTIWNFTNRYHGLLLTCTLVLLASIWYLLCIFLDIYSMFFSAPIT